MDTLAPRSLYFPASDVLKVDDRGIYRARIAAEKIVCEASAFGALRGAGVHGVEEARRLYGAFHDLVEALGYRLPTPSTNSQRSERTFSRDDLADAAHQSAREERL